MTGFAGADRRQWWGYTDMGPIQIPPNPQYLLLTDRADGSTIWWVTFNRNPPTPDGAGFISVSTTLPCNPPKDRPTANAQDPKPYIFNNCALYDAFAEPILGFINDSTFSRLFVRGGTLGASVETYNHEMGVLYAPPLFVIQTFAGVVPKASFGGQYVLIYLDITNQGTPTAPAYAWTPFTFTQTPNPAPVNSMANLNNPKADV